MAVNVGALVSMNLTPILSRFFGWHIAFAVCFIGLVIAILNFILTRASVADVGSYPDKKPLRKDYLFYVLVGAVLLLFVNNWLLQHYHIMSILMGASAVVLLGYYIRLIFGAKPQERRGMWLVFILFFQAMLFFTLYFQMPMSLKIILTRSPIIRPY